MLSYKRAAMAQSALAVPCRCAKGKDVCSPQLPTTTATTDDQRVHNHQKEMMPYFKIAKMHLLIVSSLLILYTTSFVVCDGTTKYTCSQADLNKLDSAFARVMSVSKYQRKIPEDIPQLLKYCNDTRVDFKIMEVQQKKCLTGEAKQLGNIFLYSVRNALRQNFQAKNRKSVEARTPMSKCLNRITRGTDECMESMIDSVQRGKRAQPQRQRIGYLCCGYVTYHRCVERKATPKCEAKAVTMINEYFGGLFGGVLEAVCGEFTLDSDRCDRFPPPPAKTSSDRKVKSLFYPLVELMNSV